MSAYAELYELFDEQEWASASTLRISSSKS